MLDSVYDEVQDGVCSTAAATSSRRTSWIRCATSILINGALNAKIVGQSAHTIAELAGVDVPEETKILIGEVESVELSEEFAHEKLSPVLAMYQREGL